MEDQERKKLKKRAEKVLGDAKKLINGPDFNENMSLKNFCLFLFLIKCFIRNWFGLGVNSIFIINAYIIL